MNLNAVITTELFSLRETFVARGFDLRLVGGAVRDLLRGVNPKDIDLCTDASPEEQIEVYKDANVSYHETGLQHGTLTVVLAGVPYEITSLRTETDHDGRHAVVSYTKDWMDDLSRRDLTINAMALTFDGVLIDPFGGADDLSKKIVRFVGSADDRMREDYLRILRWLRFHGRIDPTGPLDAETFAAAKRQASGMAKISRERVWMEMSKIVVGNNVYELVSALFDTGLAEHMDLTSDYAYDIFNMEDVVGELGKTKNPVTAMVALLNNSERAVAEIATKWKWSANERDLGVWLAKTAFQFEAEGDYQFLISHDEKPVEWVAELARLMGDAEVAERLLIDSHPVFPVKGQDLLDMGMAPGKEIGQTLKLLRREWADQDYSPSKDDLIAGLTG